MGIGYPAHRPGGQVDMLAVEHFAGHAVEHLTAFTDAGLHGLFHLGQRQIQREAERRQDGGVAGKRKEQGERLGAVEIEVVADGSPGPIPGGQPPAGFWILIIAEGIECRFGDFPHQTQAFGGFAAPRRREFLAGPEVIFRLTGVVGTCGGGVGLLVDAEQGEVQAGG